MGTTLTRTIRFRAWHRYHRPEWSAERNRERFGAAGEDHAHDYRCAVTVRGPLDPDTSMIIDLGELDRILAREVTASLDGKHLDRDVGVFSEGRALPTCEALAAHLYARIAAGLPVGVSLAAVRVAEDETLHAECTGEA
jgi:6-pyruvoyltetrahydropterin/6-carboxytetrahydropterin synthase